MPDVTVLDINEFTDRSNPALPVPKVLVTYMTALGQPGTLNLNASEANREAIRRRVAEEASRRYGVAPPINVRFAAHLEQSTSLPPRY